MGYFFEFKLHYEINDKGEIFSFVIIPGKVNDRQLLKYKKFVEKIKDNLYADKGYISKALIEVLLVDRLNLSITIRDNMKKHNNER